MPFNSLPEHLLSQPALSPILTRATQHPFLKHAGSGTLPAPQLTTWLVQDMHYTRGYVRFIGRLLALLHVPVTDPSEGPSAEDDEPKVLRKVLAVLVNALNGIHTEIGFFDDTARKYGLDLSDAAAQPMKSATSAYIELFNTIAETPGGSGTVGAEDGERLRGRRLLDGMLVLWATEMCYHRAWKYAASFMPKNTTSSEPRASDPPTRIGTAPSANSATRALHVAFIPNWTSEAFDSFVGDCEEAFAELADLMLGRCTGEGTRDKVVRGAEEMFRRVLELEERFWPND